MPLRSPAKIRALRAADVPFLREASREAFTEYDGDAEAAGRHAIELAFMPWTHVLVAEHERRAVGCAMVSIPGEEAHLAAIAVVPDRRGLGIGQLLVGAAERRAISRGATVMRLETGEANLAAIHLFVRSGYERIGRVPGYYRTGYDALRFRKLLVEHRGR